MSDKNKPAPVSRAWIEVTLVTKSCLHIGTVEGAEYAENTEAASQGGESSRNKLILLKGENNRAVIPGSSLRGCLRAIYKRTFGDSSELFGCGGTDDSMRSGKLQVRSALSSESWSVDSKDSAKSIGENATGHTRDPVTNAVQDNMLYSREVVRPGVRFLIKIVVHDTTTEEISRLCIALQKLPHEALGAAKRSGLGRFEAIKYGCDFQAHTLGGYQLKNWLSDSHKKTLREVAKPLKELVQQTEQPSSNTVWQLRLLPQSAFHVGSGEHEQVDGHQVALPRKLRDGRAVVPGTALKGALRAIARRLLMSMLVNNESASRPDDVAKTAECVLELLFGCGERAGCVWVSDFISDALPTEQQRFFNAIDRFTGGAADGKLYSLKVLSCKSLQGDLQWRPLRSFANKQNEKMALLHLLSAVFAEAKHLVYLGGAIGRGLGEMRLCDEANALKTSLPGYREGQQALLELLGVSVNPEVKQRPITDFLVEPSDPAKTDTQKPTGQSGSVDDIVHPYQFVNADEISAHQQDYTQIANTWQSARHDVYLPERFTGRVICRIRLQSPLLVGAKQTADGEKPADVENYQDPVSGKLAIPGSSIRGCISSVAEAISGSAMRVLDDQLLTERANHEQPLKHLGRINKTGSGWEIIEVDTQKNKVPPPGAETYTQWHGNRAGEFKQFKHGDHSLEVLRSIGSPKRLPTGGSCPVDTLAEMLRQRVLARPKDQAVEKHVFPFIPIEYMGSFDYKLAGSKDRCARQKWQKEFNKWLDGKLVYFKVEKGSVTLLSFSEIWRVQHVAKRTHLAFSRSENLPWGSADRQDMALSPAEALFGVVEERQRGADSIENHAALLASRVRFSDAHVGEGVELEQFNSVVFRELSSPKPPSPYMYFKKNAPCRALGRKQYASQNTPRWRWGTGVAGSELEKKLKRCLSGRPIKAENSNGDNTQFYFHIDAQNLSKKELGLLLWSLSPDGWGAEKGMGFRHKLGLGKPFGLGQVEIDVLGLWQRDPLAQLHHEESTAYCVADFENKGLSNLPSRYQREKDVSANSCIAIPDNSYVREKAMAELRAIGRPSSTEGKTVDYPRHQVNGKVQIDQEGFKWFGGNKERDTPYYHHTPDLSKAQGLAAFPVLPVELENNKNHVGNNKNQRIKCKQKP